MKILSYIVLIAILIASTIKVSQTNAPEFTDKIVHIIMYFFCTAAFYFIGIKRYVVFSIAYGTIIELIQYFLPWRSFSFYDIIANCIGAILFYLTFRELVKCSH